MIRNIFIILFAFSATVLFSQKGPYYQQAASYKMDIDVDAKNLSYNGTQTISYTNNSPENLDVVYFHLYWNAFKPGSMMDQRAQNRGKNGDSRLQTNGVSRLASIPKDKDEAIQKLDELQKASSSPDGLSRADSSIAQAANLNKMLIQSIQEGANYENR